MSGLINALLTEQPNPRSAGIDLKSSYEIVEIMNREDSLVVEAVRNELGNIAKSVDIICDRLRSGGRLFYIGAGTSGRLGVLDASECPPTFGTDPSLVTGIIAGGDKALRDAIEGAEDNPDLGAADIAGHGITAKDVCVGIAASGRTPYVLGAIEEAKRVGAFTIGLSNNKSSPLATASDHDITPEAGPEIILGSTRLKSGTSQKMVLNMLSTAVMIRLGKVYGNLMVDLKPSNEKLKIRAARIISLATGATIEQAQDYLIRAGGSAKTAIVMLKAHVPRDRAEELLEECGGYVSEAISAR